MDKRRDVLHFLAKQHTLTPDLYPDPANPVNPMDVIEFVELLTNFLSQRKYSPPRSQPEPLRRHKKEEREEGLNLIRKIYEGAGVVESVNYSERMKLHKFLNKSVVWHFAEHGDTTESL